MPLSTAHLAALAPELHELVEETGLFPEGRQPDVTGDDGKTYQVFRNKRGEEFHGLLMRHEWPPTKQTVEVFIFKGGRYSVLIDVHPQKDHSAEA